MIRFMPLLILLLLVACSSARQHIATKTWTDPHFSMELPASWRPSTRHGIDSYVGGVIMDHGDSIAFDWGPYANKLYEIPVVVLNETMRESWGDTDSTNVVFVPNRRQVDKDEYRLTNLSWDTIDGMKAKLVYPIRPGRGTTGVYFDSVPSARYKNSFVLYGVNLHPQSEQSLRQAIKTIRFHRPEDK